MTKLDILRYLSDFPMDTEILICNEREDPSDGANDVYEIERIEPFEDEEGRAVLLFINVEDMLMIWEN